jgi:outer membrane protein
VQVSQAALDMAEAQYQQAMAAFGRRPIWRPGFSGPTRIAPSPSGHCHDARRWIYAPLFGPGGSVVATFQASRCRSNLESAQLFDRDVTRAGLNLTYPLYTGGRKEAITGMAKKGVDIAREEKRKTELEVVRDVNKYYHGAQFAQQMEQLVSDTLERFQALEDLTDRLYQNASLKVKKTDYLRSKTTTAMTRSMLQETRYASALTRRSAGQRHGLAGQQQDQPGPGRRKCLASMPRLNRCSPRP